MVRHSRMQIQVLQLYKAFMNLARTRPGLGDYVRKEFKKNATISPTNTIQIEQVYRRGHRQFKLLQRQHVEAVNVVRKSDSKTSSK